MFKEKAPSPSLENQKIFFSYSRVDAQEFALKLANDLRQAGANIWIDQDIRPSQRWDTEVHKALTSSDCVLFIVSNASVISDNVLDEVHYALNYKKKLYPLIISNCDLPYRTIRLQHIDFIDNYEKGLTTLLKSLNISSNPTKIKGTGGIDGKAFIIIDNTEVEKNELANFNSEKNPVTLFNKGVEKYKSGRYTEAIRYFDKAIELKTDYTDAYIHRGNSYHQGYNLWEAIEDYNKALELKPDDGYTYYSRGIAKIPLNDKNGACQDLKKSCDLGYKKGCLMYDSLSKEA